MSLVGQSTGRYHVIEQLGREGMAAVYSAFDTRLERQVAIKVIRQNAAGTEHTGCMLKRFERDPKSLARLSHASIVKAHDYGETDGSPYLVMEFIQGGTLGYMTGRPVDAAAAHIPPATTTDETTAAAPDSTDSPGRQPAVPAPAGISAPAASVKKRRTCLAPGTGLFGPALVACLVMLGAAGCLWMDSSTALATPEVTVKVQSVVTKSSHTPIVTLPPASPPIQSTATPQTPDVTPTEHRPRMQDAEMIKYAVDTGSYPYIGDEAVPDEDYSDEDYDEVDRMLSFSMTVSSAQDFYIWKYGWCTTTDEILEQNMQHISIELYINGDLVPPKKIYRSRAGRGVNRMGICDSMYVLLENWPPGATDLLELLIIDESIHDGWSEYPAGMMMREYRIILPESD